MIVNDLPCPNCGPESLGSGQAQAHTLRWALSKLDHLAQADTSSGKVGIMAYALHQTVRLLPRHVGRAEASKASAPLLAYLCSARMGEILSLEGRKEGGRALARLRSDIYDCRAVDVAEVGLACSLAWSRQGLRGQVEVKGVGVREFPA